MLGLVDADASPARRFFRTYCGACHAAGGKSSWHAVAYETFRGDTLAEWRGQRAALLGALDPDQAPTGIMPPPDAERQPSEAERRSMLDWIERGSPDGPDGR